MDELTCETCDHANKTIDQYPCNRCRDHSEWQIVDDDDEEDDFELIDRGFIGIE